jgi:GNAT superfamily N-acetyltransferase
VEVKPIPGMEHLPFAEVWFHAVDDEVWREASRRARALEKTTEVTPEVVSFLTERGYEEVRRYLRSELDVATAPDPGPPGLPVVTLAERPDLVPTLYEIAAESYPDQPGRAETRMSDFETWRGWGLDPHPPEACFIAVDAQGAAGDDVLGYGFLEIDGDSGYHGFTAVARRARGRGVAGAVKRAQIRWAKARGLRVLTTANEARLVGMIALNERLGYRPRAAEIVLRGPLAPLD